MKKNTIVNYLWRDRKRFCGMPITFTKYALSDDRLFVKRGLLTERNEETLLYRIKDISYKKSLWQKLCGVGTIELQTNDATTPNITLKNITHVESVKEMIHQAVEQVKNNKQMHVTEIY